MDPDHSSSFKLNVVLGYLGDKEATSHAFCGDFYLTGDRATQDEDGYFWFKSRNDDLIISSGYRIGPFEVGFQGVTKRCRLSLLTNSALVIRVQTQGEGGRELRGFSQ
jgi:non-ribosomal peptide synthetase component E (peptide arylation enzyme)